MKTLLLGANGQVGWELRHALAPVGEVKACDRQTVNLERRDMLRAAIRDSRPELIVNAAAYTSVDKAEADPDTAKRINANAVGLMATEAKRIDAVLVHYSTDYVFDGTKTGPYTEMDTPNPLNVYGRTKLEGETAIRDSGCRHFIFRTSWVHAPRGTNFVRTMLRMARERGTLKVVADQMGTPTSAGLIARITALGLRQFARARRDGESLLGTYHLVPTGETSWYGFACCLLGEAQKCDVRLRCPPENIRPVTTDEYPLPAKRPMNSRLDTQKLSSTFNVHFPAWQTDVQRTVQELSERNAAS